MAVFHAITQYRKQLYTSSNKDVREMIMMSMMMMKTIIIIFAIVKQDVVLFRWMNRLLTEYHGGQISYL